MTPPCPCLWAPMNSTTEAGFRWIILGYLINYIERLLILLPGYLDLKASVWPLYLRVHCTIKYSKDYNYFYRLHLQIEAELLHTTTVLHLVVITRYSSGLSQNLFTFWIVNSVRYCATIAATFNIYFKLYEYYFYWGFITSICSI